MPPAPQTEEAPALFRRKNRTDETTPDDLTPEHGNPGDAGSGSSVVRAADGDASERAPRTSLSEPTTGPYDEADEPADSTLGRVDLGCLRVPVLDDVELRVDVDPAGTVVAATALHGGSQMQLSAFAAPRRAGIWPEVREEIQGALRQQGGGAEDAEGPFGAELRARVPTGPGATAPARFIGVDGPRWFLRGMITGPAATDLEASARLLEVFQHTVVVRGGEAMAPRDALPLRLPREAVEAQAEAEAQAQEASTGPAIGDPFERGPEITEVR